MNRRFANLFLAAAFALTVVGCTPQEPTSATGGAGTSTGSTAGGSSEPGATAETTGGQSQADVLPVKPKDGDDIAILDTSAGKIMIMFYPDKAPLHVENFMNLAKKGFYNGTRFHRCIPGFMIQGGDPKSKDVSKSMEWGSGGNIGPDGKEVNIRAEFSDVHHARGVVSMARSQDINSASSQFFIMVDDNASLDHQYSAFGYAFSGMDVADKIVKSGDPANNGAVDPAKAFVLKSVTITKWPVK